MLYEMNHLHHPRYQFVGQDVFKKQNTILSQGLIEIKANRFNVCNALFQS